LDNGNGAVGLWANVEKDVSVLADGVNQQINEFIRCNRFGFTFW